MAIAYFYTWTTYGTWLPGDERGWFEIGAGLQAPDLARMFEAALRMKEGAITLDLVERHLVETTIADHCAIRHWTLHAANCRTNHVHVVLTAADRTIDIPREQLKAWCTRKLRKRCPRKNWWTRRGWDVYIDNEIQLQQVISYVLEGQRSERYR